MNQHVSPDTAIRLRAAGFPQPAPEYGQRWYYIEDADNCSVLTVFEGTYFPEGILNQYVFAPTAIDILYELPDFAMYFNGLGYGANGFHVFDTLRRKADQYPTHHGNPAEAAALAWFEFNEK